MKLNVGQLNSKTMNALTDEDIAGDIRHREVLADQCQPGPYRNVLETEAEMLRCFVKMRTDIRDVTDLLVTAADMLPTIRGMEANTAHSEISSFRKKVVEKVLS